MTTRGSRAAGEPLASIDYFAHHSPFGAHASFTLGRFGKGGGFGLELGRPADQDVFIAYARQGEAPRALPFFKGYTGSAQAYTGQADRAKNPFGKWQAFEANQIHRHLGWASDTWRAGDLTFRLLSPFGPVPDPATGDCEELRLAALPALLAEVELDNTTSRKEAWAFFGVAEPAATLRPISDTTMGRLVGAARQTSWGLAAMAEPGVIEEVQTWYVPDVVQTGQAEMFRLGNCGGLLLRVPAGQKRRFTIALGFYRSGTVTSGLETNYLYTRYYSNLEDVLSTALDYADDLRAMAEAMNEELASCGLSPQRQFLLAHATHSYFGSTQLLHRTGQPVWVVNEGEYLMMNTFDLTVDHLFFEMRFHPWTVRNTMDLFADRYSYHDQVQDVSQGRDKYPGGISFTHDMGVASQFSTSGHSSYERPNLDGCFSHMTSEQLTNWVLCSSVYALKTGDDDWLQKRTGVFLECLESLLNRDHFNPRKRRGVMGLDSLRCGKGQEITTYDSLDASLGQARNNLYLAVKTWAAYVALEAVFGRLGRAGSAKTASEGAQKAAKTIASQFAKKLGYIPAVFEAGNTSAIIPAVEGLVFPYVLGLKKALSASGPYGEMIKILKRHIQAALKPGACICATSGGWKMSSTSENTWMSKIALSQFVVEQVLQMDFGRGQTNSWDMAHVRWQQVGCADWAFVDQIRCTDGKDLGSRYYPRGVTAILWLDRQMKKGKV